MQFNNAFFEALGRSPGVVNLVSQITEETAETARATAPVKSGKYRAGIITRLKFQRRVVGEVIATDPKSMVIEARTANLARAIRSRRGGRG